MVHNQKLVAAVKCNRKTLREHGEEVYLPFGSNYSILLKNLNTVKALVEVHVDGQEVISGLIVRPKQEIELERFFEGSMDKGHRLKFVEKTREISEFRGDYVEDGLVRIDYRFERQKSEPFVDGPRIRWPWRQPASWKRKFDSGEPWWEYKPSIFSDGVNTSDYTATYVSSNAQNISYSNADMNMNNLSEDALYSQISSQSQQPQQNEQGITTQGEYSNQSFVHGHIGVLESNSYSIVLQLKGYSPSQQEVEKPLTTRERIQCPACGKKWRSNCQYCAGCGTYLL